MGWILVRMMPFSVTGNNGTKIYRVRRSWHATGPAANN